MILTLIGTMSFAQVIFQIQAPSTPVPLQNTTYPITYSNEGGATDWGSPDLTIPANSVTAALEFVDDGDAPTLDANGNPVLDSNKEPVISVSDAYDERGNLLYQTEMGLDLSGNYYIKVNASSYNEFNDTITTNLFTYKYDTDDKSKLRVNCDEMDDVGIVTYYKNKPFTGIAYWLRDNGNILEDYEMVDGLKNGLNTKYSESGEVVLVLNYIDDEIDPKDEEKRYEHWRKLIQEAMESEIKEESNKNKVKEEQEVMEELSQNDNVKKNINLKNNKMNDTETISMLVTFANTIFSEHPNTFFLIAKCDNSSSDFINESNNSIKGEFEIPAELKNHIEVLKYDIDTSEAFSNGNNYLTMDIDCSVTLSIKTTKDEAIDAIEKYQEDNDDLRWNLSIKWIDADNKEQYSFDSWDEDMLEEIIEDEPCWYEED